MEQFSDGRSTYIGGGQLDESHAYSSKSDEESEDFNEQ